MTKYFFDKKPKIGDFFNLIDMEDNSVREMFKVISHEQALRINSKMYKRIMEINMKKDSFTFMLDEKNYLQFERLDTHQARSAVYIYKFVKNNFLKINYDFLKD